MKKSEKEAKKRFRDLPHHLDSDVVPVVTRKGCRMDYNEGQAVSQGFGSGIRDILAARKAAKARKGR